MKGRLIMSLPVLVTKVKYKVGGIYAYSGDMVISKDVLYYFPLVYFQSSQSLDEAWALGNVLGGVSGLGSIDLGADTLDESVRLFERPAIDLKEALSKVHSFAELETTLDAHLDEFKWYHPLTSDDLPNPIRFRKENVKQMMFTSSGVLKFETEFDEHIFKFGFFKKSGVGKALIESGFLT
jgi:hypothetical protein